MYVFIGEKTWRPNFIHSLLKSKKAGRPGLRQGDLASGLIRPQQDEFAPAVLGKGRFGQAIRDRHFFPITRGSQAFLTDAKTQQLIQNC